MIIEMGLPIKQVENNYPINTLGDIVTPGWCNKTKRNK